MKRILIIGSSGAGKSTLARRLSGMIGLPAIHLDQHYFDPDWKEPSKEEWERRVAKLILAERWIIDGNYGGTMDMRIERADTIIFLNFPSWLCLWRVLSRRWQYRGKVRPGSAEGCFERVTLDFILYILKYPYARRPAILKKLKALGDKKRVFILKNGEEVDDLIADISR